MPEGQRNLRRVIVFDLGGVLIDWNPRHLYRKLFADEVEMERFLSTVCTPEWNEEQDAGRSFAEAVALLEAQHPHEIERIRAYHLRWDEMIRGPIDETVRLLDELHQAGHPLYALTNWSAETFPVAQRRFDFLQRFTGILVSGEVRLKKPDPRIFAALAERFGFEPSDAIFIDDSPTNVAAAAAVGFHAIRFTSAAALRHELTTLGFLPDEGVAASYAVELTPPAIEGYRDGNAGIPFVTTFESGKPGPHVMVNALTHGNELCGAIALDLLHREGVRPVRGKLTLSFANVMAYARFDPRNPTATRYVDEDFNRLWDAETLDGPRRSAELTRAQAMRPLVETVDVLLDIHSMQHATAPLMMAGTLDRNVVLARQVGLPELIVCDAGHAAGRRLRDYGGFGNPHAGKLALLVECGQHWERTAADMAIATALRFLEVTGTVDPAWTRRLMPPAVRLPARQRVIEVTEAVTIASDAFTFLGDFVGMEVIPKAGTIIGYDGSQPVMTPYDNCVLIMPSRRLGRGQTAVRLGRFRD